MVILTSAFPLYREEGLNVFLYEHAKELVRGGYNVSVIAPYKVGAVRQEEWDGVMIYRHPQCAWSRVSLAYGNGIVPNLKKKPWKIFCLPFYFYYQARFLHLLHKKYPVNLVIVHWPIPQGISMWLHRWLYQSNIPYLLVFHGSEWLALRHTFFYQVNKYLIKRAKRVVAVSTYISEDIQRHTSVECISIPMGINTSLFDYRNRKRISETPIQFLYVGNLIIEKGINELAAAFAMLCKERDDVSLLLVGEGNLREKIARFFRESGCEHRVHFAGFVAHHQLPSVYAAADIFVLPSHSEGYSLVLREALASGLHCVVSALPVFQNDKQISNFVTFFQPQQTADLFDKLRKACEIYRLKESQQKAQWEYVHSYGSTEYTGKQWRELLRNTFKS